MIIVRNNILPLKGFKAMTVFPFIFVRKDVSFIKKDERHEEIHGIQQVEMALVGFFISGILYFFGCSYWSQLAILLFYIWYFVEWLIRLVFGKNAYRSISFEREAYENQGYVGYIEERKPFAWIKYLV